MNTYVKFEDVTLDIPIIDPSKRIFKKNPSMKNFSDDLIGGKRHHEKEQVMSRVIDKVSFEAKSGDSIALIGHNGSGKTTLFRLISGIYQPTFGNIEVVGKISTLLNIGSVIESDASGLQNIEIILRYSKVFDYDKEKVFSFVRKNSGLGDFLYMPIKNYSSGMQARLIFAITIFLENEISIIDEGIGTGDDKFKTFAQNMLDYHFTKIKIKFFASHDGQLLNKYCNRAFVMKKGSLLEFSDIDKAFDYYGSEEYNKN